MKKTTLTLINRIHNLRGKINRFAKCSNDNFEKPHSCELCGKHYCLKWHSWYERQVITMFGKFILWVKRAKCKSCGRTFVVLPDFIIKFCRYCKDVIRTALIKLKHQSYLKTIKYFDISISIQTLFKWSKIYKPA